MPHSPPPPPHSHSLPIIPPLPPLQMPTDVSLSLNHQNVPQPLHISAMRSPAPSFASKDSFSTTLTSPSQPAPDSPTSRSSSLVPPQSLRKSMSVDSFRQHLPDTLPNVGLLSSQGTNGSALEYPRGLVFTSSSGFNKHRDSPVPSSRHRGDSIASSTRTGYDSSYAGEAEDVDRLDIFNGATERYRHLSLKGEPPKGPHVRGGDLPLPSRAQPLSAASSLGSIATTSASSITLVESSRFHSSSSISSLTRRATKPAVAAPLAGRVRSGSLGFPAPPPSAPLGRQMSIDANSFKDDSASLGDRLTIAVLGTPGCGKSTVIRKGLKGQLLSEATTFRTPPGMFGSVPNCGSRRIARVNQNEMDILLHVIEIDIGIIPRSTATPQQFFWSDTLPKLDGVIICYDSSDAESFRPVETLLMGYQAMKLPIIVPACKSDLERQVEPQTSLEILQRYDVGLVEVSTQDQGKDKMKRLLDWLIKAVLRDKRHGRTDDDTRYRNPASPDVLAQALPWEGSRTTTPTAASTFANTNSPQLQPGSGLPDATPPVTLPLSNVAVSTSTNRTSEHDLSKVRNWDIEQELAISESEALPKDSVESLTAETSNARLDQLEDREDKKDKDVSRPAQWATLDDLLEKFLFLGISGDDPSFITHFLLTYRRFASPRNVLLAMQKRMRQLDDPSGDPMFSCFAQMRICNLLEMWIRDYPGDFAVRGAAGALSALIKSILSKTYLLHYGFEFLQFLERVPGLNDPDAAWALKVEDAADDSDDMYSLVDDDEHSDGYEDDDNHSSIRNTVGSSSLSIDSNGRRYSVLPPVNSRERKSSLPLPRSFTVGSSPPSGHHENNDPSPARQIKDLQKLAQEVMALDSKEIAQEITRIEVRKFLEIKPRNWLHFTFVSGRKDAERDSISAYNAVSNHLADWVVSLILCHDKPKARARQIEKLVEIAQQLRGMNNYSALRAFVAGINNATFPGDPSMEHFKSRSPEHAKNLQSWDVLLQHIRSHRAYRLALRNTKGACIPALEVHMSDLIRAHEGNEDSNPSDSTKIHWGKFNMMGRFISHTIQCQTQCRTANDYNFPERIQIAELFVKRPVMSDEMQKSRIASPDVDHQELYRPPIPPHPSSSAPLNKDVALIRKFFLW